METSGTPAIPALSSVAPTAHTDQPPSPRKKTRLTVNVSETQYPVVRWVSRKLFNFRLSTDPDDPDFDLWWCDGAVQPEKLSKMQPFQKINHFPGMYALARKNHLARNLGKMRKALGEEYEFFPTTWVLPAEFGDLKTYWSRYPKTTFIVKPEASSQGKGIFLTRNIDDLNSDSRNVVQKYIERPLLLEGLKFDLRIYVLVAGCDPLRIFVHEEGLARLATEEYVHPTARNLDETCMHLTNYAVNKTNPNFVFNEDEAEDDVGHKRSLTAALKWLQEKGHDVSRLRRDINEIVVKTLCAVQPSLAHVYKTCQPDDRANGCCFEILGFDILLDEHLKPWLLEVNHSPSFTTDTPLDKKVKRQVISDTLTLLDLHPRHKRRYLARKHTEIEQRTLGKSTRETKQVREELYGKARRGRNKWEEGHLGGFQKVFEEGRWEAVLRVARNLWEEWTGVPNEDVLLSKLGQRVVKAPDFKSPSVVSLATKHKRSLSTSESREQTCPSVFDRLSKAKVSEKHLPVKILPSLYPVADPSSLLSIVSPSPRKATLPGHLLARFFRERQGSVQPKDKKKQNYTTVEALLKEQLKQHSKTLHIQSFHMDTTRKPPSMRLRDITPRDWVSPFASPRDPLLPNWRRSRALKRI